MLYEVITRISEGDAFNAAKIRKSRQDVQDLGFFEKVDIKPQRVVGEPDNRITSYNVCYTKLLRFVSLLCKERLCII